MVAEAYAHVNNGEAPHRDIVDHVPETPPVNGSQLRPPHRLKLVDDARFRIIEGQAHERGNPIRELDTQVQPRGQFESGVVRKDHRHKVGLKDPNSYAFAVNKGQAARFAASVARLSTPLSSTMPSGYRDAAVPWDDAALQTEIDERSSKRFLLETERLTMLFRRTVEWLFDNKVEEESWQPENAEGEGQQPSKTTSSIDEMSGVCDDLQDQVLRFLGTRYEEHACLKPNIRRIERCKHRFPKPLLRRFLREIFPAWYVKQLLYEFVAKDRSLSLRNLEEWFHRNKGPLA